MKFTYNEIVDINNALHALHGISSVKVDKEGQAVKNEAGTYVFENKPYDLSYEVRLNTAMLIRKIKNAVESFVEQRNDIVQEAKKKSKDDTDSFVDGKEIKWGPGNKYNDSCALAIQKLGKQETEISICEVIDLKGLNIEKNKLDPAIIASLIPFFPKETKKGKKEEEA